MYIRGKKETSDTSFSDLIHLFRSTPTRSLYLFHFCSTLSHGRRSNFFNVSKYYEPFLTFHNDDKRVDITLKKSTVRRGTPRLFTRYVYFSQSHLFQLLWLLMIVLTQSQRNMINGANTHAISTIIITTTYTIHFIARARVCPSTMHQCFFSTVFTAIFTL